MDTWDIRSLDVQPHHPPVLFSDAAARVIAINLPAGEELQEHQVHEHAFLFVAEGEVDLEEDGQTTAVRAGTLAHWVPKQRHEVRATADALVFLILAPWPGEGHPSQRA